MTGIPAASGDTWWIRYLDFPRLEFLIAILVVGVLLAALPRTRLSMLALAVLAGAAAYDSFILLPYSSAVKPQELSTNIYSKGNGLRMLEANVEMTNRHDHRLLEIVRNAAPDLAWFQETNDWWAKELSALGDRMPYHVSKAQPNYFGVDLYSHFPLINPQVKYLTGSTNPSVFTGIRLPSGHMVKLYAIHPRPPQKGQSTAERDAQLLAAALAAHEDTEPHILAGDMNAVPWEDSIHQAQRVGRLLDPRIGRGLYITWNAKNPILKWPLDQILPSAGFTLLSLKVLPAFGSDHRP